MSLCSRIYSSQSYQWSLVVWFFIFVFIRKKTLSHESVKYRNYLSLRIATWIIKRCKYWYEYINNDDCPFNVRIYSKKRMERIERYHNFIQRVIEIENRLKEGGIQSWNTMRILKVIELHLWIHCLPILYGSTTRQTSNRERHICSWMSFPLYTWLFRIIVFLCFVFETKSFYIYRLTSSCTCLIDEINEWSDHHCKYYLLLKRSIRFPN